MIWELFAPILDGMTHAHDQGVIHRDIKPANIMLAMKDSTITPKIADFGIAKVLSENRSITTPGSFLGTPIYVASEVIAPQRDENGEFQPADQRVDIYSLGVLLYQMVSGKLPFTETDLNSLFFVKLYKEIPSLTQDNSDISSELEKVVMKSMARDPNARYANCREFAKELERALFPQSSRVSKLSNPSSYFSQSIAESTQLSTTAIPLSQSLAIQQPFSDFGNFGNHPKDTDNSIDFVESINMLVDDGQTQHRSKIIVYLVSLLVVIGLTWFVVGVLLHTPQTEQAPFLPKQEMVTSPPKRHEERVDKIEIPAQRIDAGHSVAVRDELDVAPDKKIIPQPPPRKTARIDKLTSQKQCRSCVQSFYRQQHNELPTLGGYTDICNYTDFQKVKRRCFRSCRSSNEYFCEAYLQQPFRSNHNDLKRRPASEIPLCRNFCKTR
jgi:serine/threonine protein kinase